MIRHITNRNFEKHTAIWVLCVSLPWTICVLVRNPVVILLKGFGGKLSWERKNMKNDVFFNELMGPVYWLRISRLGLIYFMDNFLVVHVLEVLLLFIDGFAPVLHILKCF